MTYKLRLVSAVGDRDGMALELADDEGEQLAEIFRDDDRNTLTISIFSDEPVDLTAIEMLIAEAKIALVE